MTMMFLPAMVGIMECVDMILENVLPFVLILVISTLAVMCVTGWVSQWMMREKAEKKEDMAR